MSKCSHRPIRPNKHVSCARRVEGPVPLVREAPRHPTRTCVGCRTARPQHELLRLAATPDGIRFDHQRRLPGRGAYLCPDPGCLDAAARRGANPLRRALRGAPEAETMAALEALRTYLRRGCVTEGRAVPGAESTVRSENA